MEIDIAEPAARKTQSFKLPDEHENGALIIKRARTELVPKAERERRRRLKEAQRDYGRGGRIDTKSIKDKKLRRNLKAVESKTKEAVIKAKEAEILLEHTDGFLEPETELERTYKVRQEDILDGVTEVTAKKRFELKLEQLGPYVFEYSRNGRDLLLGGRKGHIATMDWREGKLGCEVQLGETVRDVTWLHNNQFFAVAQKKNVYIYDSNGVEVHNLRQHREVTHMSFLPYHFLLTTLGTHGFLKYQDTSTGQLVTEIPTKLGSPVSLAQNPYNGIMHVGHQNGTVTLWSPNSTDPLVKLLAHKGPVRSLAIDREGRYMVSAGQDNKMAVWDIRMFKAGQQLFHKTTGILYCHLGSRLDSCRLGHEDDNMERALQQAQGRAREGPESVYGVGRRGKADRASQVVPFRRRARYGNRRGLLFNHCAWRGRGQL